MKVNVASNFDVENSCHDEFPAKKEGSAYGVRDRNKEGRFIMEIDGELSTVLIISQQPNR
ncbi:MAG: hypothetical protein ABSG57_04975 [Candidatus Bathyarchaeia archaeon]